LAGNQIQGANQALTDNPKLANNPGLAHDVITSANPQTSAVVLAHGYGQTTTQQAIQDNMAQAGNESVWQKMFGGAAKAVVGSLTYLAKPLQEVQRDYKYVHSVYTRHGIFEGLLASAGIAGGMALGAFAGPEGIIAGGTMAAALERNIIGRFNSVQRDSFNDSNDPNYKVSAGRDFANALSHVPGMGDLRNTDRGLGKIVSGATDMAFDFTADPLVVAAKSRQMIMAGKFLNVDKGVITTKPILRSLFPGVQDFLERNSLQTFSSPEQLDKLHQAGKSASFLDRLVGGAGIKYNRALDEIAKVASADGAGGVIAKFPGLQGLAEFIAPKAGSAVTAEDVHKVFIQATWDKEFMSAWAVGGQSMVPARTVLRAVMSKSADKMRQWDANDELYLRANQTNFFLPKKAQTATLGDVIDPATGEITQGVQAATDKTWNMPVVFRPFSGDAWKSALAGKVRTFSGYLPYTIDTKTLELSNMKFDPNDAASALSVYRIARFSMSDQMARQKVTEFVAGDIGEKRSIYSGMLNEMNKAAGIPNDANFVRDTMDTIATHVEGTLPDSNYGVGHILGNKASEVSTSTGTVRQAAFEDQRGYFSMPDFREVKTAMRNAGTYGKLYGRIDNFAAKYTDGIFKPLALLTGGFGLRIAASELIPSVFRFGSLNVAKSKIAGAAVKMNYKLAKGEDEKILENATAMLAEGGNAKEYIAQKAAEATGKPVRKTIAKGLNKLASEEDLDLASRIAIATGGHMGVGATLTGHGIPVEQQEFMRQIVELAGLDGNKMYLKPTGKYSYYTNADHEFHLHYYGQLSKAATTTSRRQIVADALKEIKSGKTADDAWEIATRKDEARIMQKSYIEPTADNKFGSVGTPLPKNQDLYADERRVLASYKNEDPIAFATRRADIMRNLFTGPEGDVNTALMTKIANGEKPSLESLRNLDVKMRPTAVAGQKYEITVGPNLLNRITNFGFGKVIDPIVNNLSRQPLYFNHVKNEMGSLKFAVDKNFLSEEEATRIAMTRGAFAMVPQIHNVALRTQFSVLVRNYLPFYFAQEQAMRRAGNLIVSNPAAFRQYQLTEQGLNDPGFVETDSLGQRHVTLPVIGELGSSFLSGAAALGMPVVGGLPVNATGSMTSLKTVLPEFQMPGVAPFVSIGLNSLGSLDPALDRQIKLMVGGAGFSRSLFDQLIPNAPARSLFKALNANETESSFYNAMISSIASAQYHGQIPSTDASPLAKQAFLDRIKNNARSILIMKALLGTISPLAPAVSQEDPGLRDEFYKMLKQTSPVTGKPMTFPEALSEFLTKHGDNAVSYTISRTEAAVPGAMMPYTNQAINWIQNHKDLIYGPNAIGAAFLIPQVTSLSGDAQAIHDEMIKMHLRGNKTPDEFLTAVYVAAGNNAVYKDKPIHDKAMEDLKKAGLSQADERANWSNYIQQYGQSNPLWWDDYSSTARIHVAQQAVVDLTNIFNSKNPPNTDQAKMVKGLLNDWTNHNQAMATYRSSYSSDVVATEKDNWTTYLDKVAQEKPQLNSIINTVFRRLG